MSFVFVFPCDGCETLVPKTDDFKKHKEQDLIVFQANCKPWWKRKKETMSTKPGIS